MDETMAEKVTFEIVIANLSHFGRWISKRLLCCISSHVFLTDVDAYHFFYSIASNHHYINVSQTIWVLIFKFFNLLSKNNCVREMWHICGSANYSQKGFMNKVNSFTDVTLIRQISFRLLTMYISFTFQTSSLILKITIRHSERDDIRWSIT